MKKQRMLRLLGLWSCVDRVSDLHQIHGRVPFIALQRDNAWVVWERRLGGSGTNSSQTHRWRGESAANSSRKSNSRAAPQWVDSTGIGNDSWCRKSGTGNNRAKTQHFRHFWMSISRLSIARARAESPNAASGTSGLTDPLLKSKNYSRKLCG